MRTFTTTLFATLLLCLSFSATAKPQAKPIPQAQREIQAVYNQIDAALGRKDVDTAFDFNTEDSEFYDKNGHPQDVADARQEAIQLLADIDTYKRKSVIVSFSGGDTDATVTVRYHSYQTVANAISGRSAQVVTDESYRDYWVKTDDGWRRKRSRSLSIKAKIHRSS